MKKYKYISLLYCVILLILEAVPYGAVCVFSSDGGEAVRQTYSYFSLIPYGYANFGPLLTAIMTVILTLLCIIRLFVANRRLFDGCVMINAVALFTSILPLLSGISYITVLSIIIAFILFRMTAINIVLKRQV